MPACQRRRWTYGSGKGLDYLAKHEARDPAAFARSQLAGVKLLLLAILWSYLLEVMEVVVFGEAVRRLPAQLELWTLDLPVWWNCCKPGAAIPGTRDGS